MQTTLEVLFYLSLAAFLGGGVLLEVRAWYVATAKAREVKAVAYEGF